MIKIIFDHTEGFGKVTDNDFIYSDPKGIALSKDYINYLEAGWIEWGKYWYNLRSVRLNINKYSPSKTTKKLSNKITYTNKLLTYDIVKKLESIYNSYIEKHQFKRDINLEDFLKAKNFFVLLYYKDDSLIGANIYKIYRQMDETAFVSYQFLWDYNDPKLSLGNVSQFYEIEFAKSMDCKYVYLLGGYETKSIYKSNFKGFEWWTGSIWSTDVEMYKSLCLRDDNVHIRT